MAEAQAGVPGNGAPAQALEKKKPSTLRELIEKSRDKFKEVLPSHLSVDRLVRVTIACIARTPALAKCTQASVLNSIMQAAQLGLEPTGVLGSAYLVPYNVAVKDQHGKKTGEYREECQLIVGYRGLIDLARRSGQIESIEAHVVHENDRFTCKYGLTPVLEHEPCWHGDPGKVVAAYAVAKLKDGGKQIEVMTRAQLDAIKLKTQSKGAWGPWKDHEEEMQRKTLVRRIAKYLPLTPELADALATDAEAHLEPQDVTEVLPAGVAGVKAAAAKAAKTRTVETETVPDEEPTSEEPPHDGETGEVTEQGAASESEQATATGGTDALERIEAKLAKCKTPLHCEYVVAELAILPASPARDAMIERAKKKGEALK